MRYRTAIAIIGSTTSGKTKVAFELARRAGTGEVVNLDKMGCYKHFPISTGAADALSERDTKKHLYKILEPNQEIIPAETFIEMVRKECTQILSGGGWPIIEGGSTAYCPALLVANRQVEFCKPIIGLRPPPGFDLREKISERLAAAITHGLIDEIREGMSKYERVALLPDTPTIIQIIRYIEGRINLEEAREEIISYFLNYARKQTEILSLYPEIIWMEHEPRYLSQTVEKIKALASECA